MVEIAREWYKADVPGVVTDKNKFMDEAMTDRADPQEDGYEDRHGNRY